MKLRNFTAGMVMMLVSGFAGAVGYGQDKSKSR